MTVATTLKRVVDKETECGFEIITGIPVTDGRATRRGFEVPIPFLVRLKGQPKEGGRWVPIDEMLAMYASDTIIRAQWEGFLEQAVAWLRTNPNKIEIMYGG